MSLSCSLGFHSWDGCRCLKCSKVRDERHSWGKDDCSICEKCGKVIEQNHLWNGCQCSKCGKVRDELHSWKKDDCSVCEKCGKVIEQNHFWEGCKCSKCGKTRDEGHFWKTDDCSVCKKCGKVDEQNHSWDGCKCSKCEKVRDEQHFWDGCKCTQCDAKRDVDHIWDKCRCIRCYKKNPEADFDMHDWEDWHSRREMQIYRSCKNCGIEVQDAVLNMSNITSEENFNRLISIFDRSHPILFDSKIKASALKAINSFPLIYNCEEIIKRLPYFVPSSDEFGIDSKNEIIIRSFYDLFMSHKQEFQSFLIPCLQYQSSYILGFVSRILKNDAIPELINRLSSPNDNIEILEKVIELLYTYMDKESFNELSKNFDDKQMVYLVKALSNDADWHHRNKNFIEAIKLYKKCLLYSLTDEYKIYLFLLYIKDLYSENKVAFDMKPLFDVTKNLQDICFGKDSDIKNSEVYLKECSRLKELINDLPEIA